MSNNGPHTTGYMKPPKDSQFKPGKSGNPKGRPRKPKTPYQILKRIQKRKVTVESETQKIGLDHALMFRLRELALSGNPKAIQLQQKIVEMSGAFEKASDPRVDPEDVKRRLAEFINASFQKSETDGNTNNG